MRAPGFDLGERAAAQPVFVDGGELLCRGSDGSASPLVAERSDDLALAGSGQRRCFGKGIAARRAKATNERRFERAGASELDALWLMSAQQIASNGVGNFG